MKFNIKHEDILEAIALMTERIKPVFKDDRRYRKQTEIIVLDKHAWLGDGVGYTIGNIHLCKIEKGGLFDNAGFIQRHDAWFIVEGDDYGDLHSLNDKNPYLHPYDAISKIGSILVRRELAEQLRPFYERIEVEDKEI